MAVRAIDHRTVHQICSGQVVLSLAVAVKELVENALDAGATCIDVRLRESGSELVEVADNGSGVEPTSFAALVLKHHTSKLRDFTDLASVGTLGFRGEALSSLCALSDLVVTTCHSSQSAGARIEYDSNGHIKSQTSCAREIGTTVSLHRLFHPLPVRYKEFHRNLKKEYARMVQRLQGYCLVNTGVRITCHNQTGKGKKQLILSTCGNLTVRENIIDVFGPKQFQQLVEVSECSASDINLEEESVTAEALKLFRLSGYVSRCGHGYGRSTTDRQFLFFNGRPCDHPKLSRTVNDVYHSYNRHQFPFLLFNIITAQEHVDVNLTPDKRQVMLHQEKALMVLVKASLMKIFEPMQSQYDANSLSGTTSRTCSTAEPHSTLESLQSPSLFAPSTSTPSLSKLSSLKRSFSYANASPGEAVSSPKPKQPKLFDCGITPVQVPISPSAAEPVSQPSLESATTLCDLSATMSCDTRGHFTGDSTDSNAECTRGINLHRSHAGQSLVPPCSGDSQNATEGEVGCSEEPLPGVCSVEHPNQDNLDITKSCYPLDSDKGALYTVERLVLGGCPEQETTSTVASSVSSSRREDSHAESVRAGWKKSLEGVTTDDDSRLSSTLAAGCGENEATVMEIKIDLAEQSSGESALPCPGSGFVEQPFDLNATAARLEAIRAGRLLKTGGGHGSFSAKISPESNSAAEDELRREIKKESFTKMEVLGQFNLGFIIAKLDSDLFIVDQHATDEKYNFERLQKETVLEHQRLILPRALELTAVNEGIIMDNLGVFRMNGFQFSINADALPTQRVKLTAQPVSKGWTFGPDDIDELIFLLSDSPGEMVRPSRVRAMFAMRSCRSSIMIGTPLTKAAMKKLLFHMSEIDQPWNCPHGRPTMRHLIDLSQLQDCI